MQRVARCACGAVSICVSGDPVAHAVCHCNNCKQRTGSAFGISAYFRKRDVVRVAGETNVYAFHNQSLDHDQERHFCRQCGTTLYWHTSTLPGLVGIAGGCFADDPPGEPNMAVSAAKKMPWVTLPDTWQVSE